MTTRPDRSGRTAPSGAPKTVAFVGVGTEVGKTWAASRLATVLRSRGLRVGARKPVQSFAPAEAGGTDAEVLAAATGEEPHEVCPPHRWYPLPMAPPMAAEALDREAYTAADLLAELHRPPHLDVVLVETAGGVRSPVAADADSAGLVGSLRPDHTVLVADAGLGTINAVRLAVGALAGHDPLVFLNRYDDRDDLHRRNRCWLADRDGFSIAVHIDELADRISTPPGASPGPP